MPPGEAGWVFTLDPDHVRIETVGAGTGAALSRLRAVHSSYWDQDWRREHRGSGRYPEHHLWEAVQGYLDLYDAAESADRAPGEDLS